MLYQEHSSWAREWPWWLQEQISPSTWSPHPNSRTEESRAQVQHWRLQSGVHDTSRISGVWDRRCWSSAGPPSTRAPTAAPRASRRTSSPAARTPAAPMAVRTRCASNSAPRKK
uniref:Uncharacterized protein n=1 Tax=Marmota marmota marmota TaxID=9994 RepID=A0A8C5ZLM3_MARMA